MKLHPFGLLVAEKIRLGAAQQMVRSAGLLPSLPPDVREQLDALCERLWNLETALNDTIAEAERQEAPCNWYSGDWPNGCF